MCDVVRHVCLVPKPFSSVCTTLMYGVQRGIVYLNKHGMVIYELL